MHVCGVRCRCPQGPQPTAPPPLCVVTPHPPNEPEGSSTRPGCATRIWKHQETGRVGTCGEHPTLAVWFQGPEVLGKEGSGDLGSTPALNSHVYPASEPLSPPRLGLSLCYSLGYFHPCPCGQIFFFFFLVKYITKFTILTIFYQSTIQLH